MAKGGVKPKEAKDGDAGVVRQIPPEAAAGLEGKIVNSLVDRGVGASPKASHHGAVGRVARAPNWVIYTGGTLTR